MKRARRSKPTPLAKRDLVLEIGTEEIPSNYLEPAAEQLKANAEKSFREARLLFKTLQTFASPRRLVLHVTGLASIQEEQTTVHYGPPKDVAYDPSGNPTPALLGFLKKQNAAPETLVMETKGNRAYVAIVVTTPGEATASVLARLLPGLVGSLAFPKMMHWDAGVLFARPIRWILALYGGGTLSFNIGRVASGRVTRGRRAGAAGPFLVEDAKAYFRILKTKAGVMLDAGERRAKIRSEALRLCKKAGLDWVEDRALLDTSVYLTEAPQCFLGGFRHEYLSLPREVLTAAMAKAQKLFPTQQKGKLACHFVGVLNGKPGDLERVRSDYEAILDAKLKDARFFYQEDTQEPLQEKIPKLAGIIYLKGLGTMRDKADRMADLCLWMGRELALSADEITALEKAAWVCKADLVTHMVREFPTLQGTIGQAYALRSGLAPEIAQAVSDHYLPKLSEDPIPTQTIARLVAAADRMDHLIGCFALNLAVTGSEDPWALRRAANGLVRIVLEGKLGLDLFRLAETAAAGLPEGVRAAGEGAAKRAASFLLDRLRGYWQEKGYRPDLIDAVLAVPTGVFGDLELRLVELTKVWGSDRFKLAFKVIERTHRIAKGVEGPAVEIDESLLIEPQEKELYEVLAQSAPRIEELLKNRAFAEATERFGEVFYDPIHRFFEKVMVMVDDEKLKANRLALLRRINRLYVEKVADLSKVLVET